MRFAGRVALVTGAGQGIGLAIARRLAEEGARVVLADIRPGAAKQGARAIVARKGEAVGLACDVRQRSSIARLVTRAEQAFGRVEILVNNAAVQPVHEFFEVTEREWDEVVRVNLRGPFLLSQEVARRLVAAKRGGVIVNLASTSSVVARPDMVPYAASKGGIAMLTRGMAVALAHYGIRVLAVAPGTIRTPNTESSLRTDSTLSRILSRTPMGIPADIAGVVAFLASPDAGYMTGTTVYVDGGRLALGHVKAQRPLARMVGSSDSTHGVRRSGSPRR